MKLEELPIEFEQARPVLQTLESAGFEAYFVGGCVRDTILGKPLHDVDIATSAYPEEVKRLFSRTVDTGIDHGTVMILDHGTGYETTTFRSESTYTDFRRPDEVTFVRDLAEDLKRRDFTINALAMKEDGTVIDLFNGLADLEHHVIRAVGNPEERFHEDALRMMRAVRFASQLAFNIEPETQQAIKDNAALLTKIAVERIQVELIKLLTGKAPQMGWSPFMQTNLATYCPTFAAYPAGLSRISNRLTQACPDELSAWTLLATAFQLTSTETAGFMRTWKTSNVLNQAVVLATKAAETLLQESLATTMLYRTGRANLLAANFVAHELGAPDRQPELEQAYDELPIKTKKELAITGRDLIQTGIQPGPQLGQILANLEQQVVLGQIANDPTQLLAAAKQTD
ncbi:CCA tRNA nucleotidyltransferase [Levilactobacillus bambusae]|uniref:CCA-adding enzyme n=1 Tax=Levilactobacillus bambusae TaxID=2024736 RepID=A0A2V1N2E5_9LACO|nr:CCA tRNA nucleotidyltransferase [Levilactobacillus bambusae]PWG00808.1 CCA tRNA nucleotidyltransferase [Levilactobacillus bambusae]